ncbi:MAG TPA: FtsX-like permease family protein, partial [Burkholderiaceae bacterium]|nr:FtsX-like permease family protein [Burkholderiaceae bacterium]
PALLAQQPQTWMTAVYLPAQAESVVAQLLREAPNLTVIDTGALIAQVKEVLDKVSGAVEGLFALTLLAGVLVLYGAIVATHDERVREVALMRALGASSKQLARAQRTELLLLGALAGLLAAMGASAMGWALAHFVFEFRFTPSVGTFAVGVVGGCVCALLSGHYGLRRVLRSPPLRSLSEV